MSKTILNPVNMTRIGTKSDIFCQQQPVGEINICLSNRYYKRIILFVNWYNFCYPCLIVIELPAQIVYLFLFSADITAYGSWFDFIVKWTVSVAMD